MVRDYYGPTAFHLTRQARSAVFLFLAKHYHLAAVLRQKIANIQCTTADSTDAYYAPRYADGFAGISRLRQHSTRQRCRARHIRHTRTAVRGGDIHAVALPPRSSMWHNTCHTDFSGGVCRPHRHPTLDCRVQRLAGLPGRSAFAGRNRHAGRSGAGEFDPDLCRNTILFGTNCAYFKGVSHLFNSFSSTVYFFVVLFHL